MLYGILGGKEFFANSQKYLERKVTLECDGTPVSLPTRLQGLVFLNIPSYMAGTNFWGTDREKRVRNRASGNKLKWNLFIEDTLIFFIKNPSTALIQCNNEISPGSKKLPMAPACGGSTD